MKFRRLWLILLYMAIIFCVILVEMRYAKQHPLEENHISNTLTK